MYNGIKPNKNRARAKLAKVIYPSKFQMLVTEEVETNAIVSQQMKRKTIDMSPNPDIKWQDFEVKNLLAAGIDVKAMTEVYMSPNKDKIMANAETANEMLDMYELMQSTQINQQQEQQQTQENNA